MASSFFIIIILAFVLNFHKTSSNVSLQNFLGHLSKSNLKLNNLSPLLNFPLLIVLLISFIFNPAIILCVNTRVLVLTNQYSAGLFVGYTSHGKPQLYEIINIVCWHYQCIAPRLPELSNPFWDPGAPCRSIRSRSYKTFLFHR
jgi:hypothetical protein